MSRHTVRAALLGQALAILICGTAVSSTSLARQGVSAPTLQSALNYLLLGIVFTAVRVRSSGWRLKCRWWAYAFLALLDVEANFCVVLAYRYTSLTSVTLLDCFSIPMVVALSTILLGAAYRKGHYAGAGICIAGLLVLVATDRSGGEAAAGGTSSISSNPLLGDGLVLLGATLYAVCNVLQEWLLGDVPVSELLGTMGLFGCLWSAAQGLPLELHILRAANWTPTLLLPFLGFSFCMFAFYSLVPLELTWGGAALLNISLLSSDLWAALARFFFFGGFQDNSLLFFALSFLVVALGIGLFTWSGDVETQLGAGSSLARSMAPEGGGLPVVTYQRVSSSTEKEPGFSRPRLPLPSLSSGGGGKRRQALEAVQRQQAAASSAADVATVGTAPAQQRALPNPFDIAGLPGGGRGGGGSSNPAGFAPLASTEAEDPVWGEPTTAVGGHSPRSAGVQPVAAAAAAAAGRGTGAGRQIDASFDVAKESF